MTSPKRKPVFIEKIMPVTLLKEQVYFEHGGNPFKGLRRWHSRKPLSFSRASVLGSLLPADVTIEEFGAIANYRFRKLTQTDTAGFDPLTTWYMLAWDAFRAREFPFDDARQLALAVGGFNVADLAKTYKLLDSTSGN